uniref:dnaJ homolog subfamily B member 12-like n=1 Tax=Oncorhynchus gorbuscha TaxID=8017 RepID=UPI001EAE9D1A|nr:dnaJ homolog subfamily B member 12-like [Oncorhynchus gorbuscha]
MSLRKLNHPFVPMSLPVLRCSGTGHIHRRQTQTLKVPYYVGASFTERYSGKDLKTASPTSGIVAGRRRNRRKACCTLLIISETDLYQRAQQMGGLRLSEIQIRIQG